MGKILEFPLWRAQRSLPAGEVSAQVVIFPGVRREPGSMAAERLAAVPHGAPGLLREDRER